MSLFTAKGESGFQRLPEGHQVLLVKGVEFDPEFFTDSVKEVVVILATKSGIEHKEKFNVAIDGGAKAFTFLMKTVHNRFDIKEGESLDELVATAAGHFIKTNVVHEVAKNREGEVIKTRAGETVINVRLNDKRPSTGWDMSDEPQDEEVMSSDDLDIADETDEFQF